MQHAYTRLTSLTRLHDLQQGLAIVHSRLLRLSHECRTGWRVDRSPLDGAVQCVFRCNYVPHIIVRTLTICPRCHFRYNRLLCALTLPGARRPYSYDS
jgi:hypothetical protein